MTVLVYGSEDISSRIKLLFDSSDIEIVTITEKITRPKDMSLLRKLRNIDLAIVDVNETGAEKACKYLGRMRKITIALLVDEGNTDWEEVKNYPVFAYIPKDVEDQEFTSHIERIIARIRTSDFYLTEEEERHKELGLVLR